MDSHPRHSGYLLVRCSCRHGPMAEKQHTSCIQQHCIEASADSLHTNHDQVLVLWSPLWIELRVWVGLLFQHIALLQHHKFSLLAVSYSQLYNLLLLSGLWLTRTTCVSNCARGCESIHSGIGIVWLTHPNPKTHLQGISEQWYGCYY